MTTESDSFDAVAARFGAPAKALRPVPPSPWVSAASFEGKPVPERQWHVPGMMPAATVTGLSGDGGTGKSTLAAQLAVSTVLGLPWLGQPITRGPALYVSCEDGHDELHRRIAAICDAAEIAPRDLDDLTLRSFAGQDAVMFQKNRAEILEPRPPFVELRSYLADCPTTLLIIDNIGDTYGGDENNRAHVRQFVNAFRGLSIDFDVTTLMLSHPSLEGMRSRSGSSGSTAWNAAFRSRLYLRRIEHGDGDDRVEPDPNARVIEVVKSNYGPRGASIKLEWREGTFHALDAVGTSLDRAAASEKAQRVFLQLLRAFSEDGRVVSDRTGANYAPARFAEDPRAEGVTRSSLRAAMVVLFAKGRLRVEETGPPSKRRRAIIEVSND